MSGVRENLDRQEGRVCHRRKVGNCIFFKMQHHVLVFILNGICLHLFFLVRIQRVFFIGPQLYNVVAQIKKKWLWHRHFCHQAFIGGFSFGDVGNKLGRWLLALRFQNFEPFSSTNYVISFDDCLKSLNILFHWSWDFAICCLLDICLIICVTLIIVICPKYLQFVVCCCYSQFVASFKSLKHCVALKLICVWQAGNARLVSWSQDKVNNWDNLSQIWYKKRSSLWILCILCRAM